MNNQLNFYFGKVEETNAKIQELSALLNELIDYADRHNISYQKVSNDVGLNIEMFNSIRRKR